MESWLLKDDLSEYLGEQLGKSEYLLYFRYHEGIIINFFLSVWKALLWRMFFILRRCRLKTLGLITWSLQRCAHTHTHMKKHTDKNTYKHAHTHQYTGMFRKRPQRAPSALPPCERTARRRPSVNQEAGPCQTSNLSGPWSQTCSLQNYGMMSRHSSMNRLGHLASTHFIPIAHPLPPLTTNKNISRHCSIYSWSGGGMQNHSPLKATAINK